MIEQKVNNPILVQYYVLDLKMNDYVSVGYYWTNDCSVLMKTLIECYKNRISIKFDEFSSDINKDYCKHMEYEIKDLEFQLGTEEDLFVLNVYLE